MRTKEPNYPMNTISFQEEETEVPISLKPRVQVEVFKTNVSDSAAADLIRKKLQLAFPECKINFDLQDCDKILRIEGNQVLPATVTDLVKSSGFHCEVLN